MEPRQAPSRLEAGPGHRDPGRRPGAGEPLGRAVAGHLGPLRRQGLEPAQPGGGEPCTREGARGSARHAPPPTATVPGRCREAGGARRVASSAAPPAPRRRRGRPPTRPPAARAPPFRALPVRALPAGPGPARDPLIGVPPCQSPSSPHTTSPPRRPSGLTEPLPSRRGPPSPPLPAPTPPPLAVSRSPALAAAAAACRPARAHARPHPDGRTRTHNAHAGRATSPLRPSPLAALVPHHGAKALAAPEPGGSPPRAMMPVSRPWAASTWHPPPITIGNAAAHRRALRTRRAARPTTTASRAGKGGRPLPRAPSPAPCG